MATQWPIVQARLVALLPTLPGWDTVNVIAGEQSRDPELPVAVATVGFTTVGYTSIGDTGSCRFEQAADGFGQIETGTVACEITLATGDSDGTASETAVWAALDAVKAAVQADRRLGVLSPDGTSSFTIGGMPTANSEGTAYTARFALDYFTVTY